MEKKIDYNKPIYWQEQYGSYDVCIPPFNGYQVTKERDPELFMEIELYIKANPDKLIPEPTIPPEVIKAQRIAEIKAECDLLDAKSIRPMRDGETELVAEIKAQIAVLREEYNNLIKTIER